MTLGFSFTFQHDTTGNCVWFLKREKKGWIRRQLSRNTHARSCLFVLRSFGVRRQNQLRAASCFHVGTIWRLFPDQAAVVYEQLAWKAGSVTKCDHMCMHMLRKILPQYIYICVCVTKIAALYFFAVLALHKMPGSLPLICSSAGRLMSSRSTTAILRDAGTGVVCKLPPVAELKMLCVRVSVWARFFGEGGKGELDHKRWITIHHNRRRGLVARYGKVVAAVHLHVVQFHLSLVHTLEAFETLLYINGWIDPHRKSVQTAHKSDESNVFKPRAERFAVQRRSVI